jgi:urease accessory protein
VDPNADAEVSITAPASGWTDTEVSVRLRRAVGDTVRVDGTLCSAPVWVRWDGTTLWLVGSGASPVGEDRIRVHVDVGPGVDVTVRSVAATVVYAARDAGTRWDTDIDVAEGASVVWRPEPVILTQRARHVSNTTVRASNGGTVTLDELLVLGRAGETSGALRSTLAVHVDDAPVLLTSIDTSLPGWAGPAGVDRASVVAHRLHVGEREARVVDAHARRDVALLEPAPGCALAVAATVDVDTARNSLDAALRV